MSGAGRSDPVETRVAIAHWVAEEMFYYLQTYAVFSQWDATPWLNLSLSLTLTCSGFGAATHPHDCHFCICSTVSRTLSSSLYTGHAQHKSRNSQVQISARSAAVMLCSGVLKTSKMAARGRARTPHNTSAVRPHTQATARRSPRPQPGASEPSEPNPRFNARALQHPSRPG